MPEYIDREELLKDINETVVFTVRKGVQLPTAEIRGANKVIDRIKSASTADVVEVRHGEWITAGVGITERVICSVCKSDKGSFMKPPFCNQCGAKMDGKEVANNG